MAWHFVRLRIRIFLNSLTRGSSAQRTFGLLGLGLGLAVGVVGAVVFISARGEPNVGAAALLFVGVFAFGWVVLPLLLFSSDNTIDPMRFSLLPLLPGQLVRGQLVAGLISGVGLFGVLTVGSAAFAVSDSLSTMIVGGLAAVLTLLLCMVASRALTTSIGGALRSRRGRDFALLVGALLAASIYPVQIAVQSYVLETGLDGVDALGDAVAWTPFGWPLAAVLDAVDGRWALAGLRLAGTGAVVAILLVVWARAVTRTLEAPEHAGAAGPAGAGELAPAWTRQVLPDSPTGAVAAKELRYWWRDPRRRAAAFTGLLVGLGVTVAPFLSGEGLGRRLAFAGVGPAIFATMNSANQFGLDGSAIWVDVAVPGSAHAHVRGRQLAAALLIIPVVALITLIGSLITRAPLTYAAAGLGLCLAAVGCGLAVTSVVSVVAPYPTPENPSNPFAGTVGGGFTTFVYQLGGLIAQVALVTPVGVLVVWGIVAHMPGALWAVFLVGPAWGFAAARLGAVVGAAQFDRRGPELLAGVSPRSS